MPRVAVLGGGLAGLAAAAALGQAGYEVDILESKAYLGGRATSYPVTSAGGPGEIIDNCQHILLRCCVNLLNFYNRLGCAGKIHFHREFFFIEPGGRVSVLKRGLLPAPAQFTEAFLRMKCLDLGDKVAIGRALLAIRSERRSRKDLDQITMLEWLVEKRQTPRAIERFWRQVLVSAINEELDRMAAAHGFQVLWLGFLAASDSYEMGIPAVPLGELYGESVWSRVPRTNLHFRAPVERIVIENRSVNSVRAGGADWKADAYVCALPFERVNTVAPELGLDFAGWEHSPITGIHLWFDRPVTDLPHGTLLDRTIQWFFNKEGGRYLQLVVSASRGLLETPRQEVIDLAVGELAEFLPSVREAKLEKAHVVKEVRATFAAKPGMEALRPEAVTKIRSLFLAGDWTRSGWPATMEGAVRSGYKAAEAVTESFGNPKRFLVPEIA